MAMISSDLSWSVPPSTTRPPRPPPVYGSRIHAVRLAMGTPSARILTPVTWNRRGSMSAAERWASRISLMCSRAVGQVSSGRLSNAVSRTPSVPLRALSSWRRRATAPMPGSVQPVVPWLSSNATVVSIASDCWASV